MSFNVISIDEATYPEGLMFQEALFQEQLKEKSQNKPTTNHLIFLQHTPVYTLGKSGDIKNLKVPIESTDAEYYKTNRGGDITYHGPGQLTAYPIFNLDDFGLGVRNYVELLEECIIDCIAEYGLKGERISDASGVWLDAEGIHPRKICAVGIKVSRGITMHGLAFNINTDLSYFQNIIPCGLEDKGVTSLEKELSQRMNFNAVLETLLKQFQLKFKKIA